MDWRYILFCAICSRRNAWWVHLQKVDESLTKCIWINLKPWTKDYHSIVEFSINTDKRPIDNSRKRSLSRGKKQLEKQELKGEKRAENSQDIELFLGKLEELKMIASNIDRISDELEHYRDSFSRRYKILQRETTVCKKSE